MISVMNISFPGRSPVHRYFLEAAQLPKPVPSNQAPWRPQLPGELSNGRSRTQPGAEMGASVVVHLLPASGGGVYVCVCSFRVRLHLNRGLWHPQTCQLSSLT